MQFETWCFNPALFRNNLRRYWPILALSVLCWGMYMPLRAVNMILSASTNTAQLQSDLNGLVAGAAGQCYWIALIDAIVCALAVFNYLFQHRSAVAIHSMPLRRECLFITNYLSGLALMVLPMLANLLIMAVIEAAVGCLNLSMLLMWLTAQLLASLFFFSFAVFCSALTGNLVGMVLFYAGLQAAPYVVYQVLTALAGTMLYGFQSFTFLNTVTRWLSPLWNMMENVTAVSRYLEDETWQYFLHGWKCLLLYFLVGLLLGLADLLLYRLRRVETAGDVIAIPVLRPVFLYGFTGVVGLGVGYFLYILLRQEEVSVSWSEVGVLLLLIFLCGFIGYFAAQMMLQKTARVFHRGWLGYGACMLCLGLIVCAFKVDVMGFQTWVPRADNVASVSISVSPASGINFYSGNDRSCTLSETSSIQEVLAFQQAVTENIPALQEAQESYHDELSALDYDDLTSWTNSHDVKSVTLTYTMANGDIHTRIYSIYVDEEQLAQSGSAASLLQEIINLPEYSQYIYQQLAEDAENTDMTAYLECSTYSTDDAGRIGEYYISFNESSIYTLSNGMTSESPENEGATLLLDAILADLAEGTLSTQNWLLYADALENEPDSGTISLSFDPKQYDYTQSSFLSSYSRGSWYSLTINESWSNTIAALETLGVLDEEHQLLTLELLQVSEEYDFFSTTDYYSAVSRGYVSNSDSYSGDAALE